MTACLMIRRIDAFVSLARHLSVCRKIPPSRMISYATEKPDSTIHLRIPTPEDMEEIAALLSVSTTPGDTILLDGKCPCVLQDLLLELDPYPLPNFHLTKTQEIWELAKPAFHEDLFEPEQVLREESQVPHIY